MFFEVNKERVFAFKTIAFYLHIVTAFSFIISQDGEIGNKKRAHRDAPLR